MADFDSINSTEYVYDQKNEGKVKTKRTLMVIAYVLFITGFFIMCMATKILPLFAIGPLLLYILVLCTWRIVKFDCYWDFGAGTLTIGKIKVNKNGRRKNPKVCIHVKEALDIGYYETGYMPEGVDKVYDYSESPTSDKRIYILFRDGDKTALAIIEGTARLGSLLTSFCDKAHDIKGKPFHG